MASAIGHRRRISSKASHRTHENRHAEEPHQFIHDQKLAVAHFHRIARDRRAATVADRDLELVIFQLLGHGFETPGFPANFTLLEDRPSLPPQD